MSLKLTNLMKCAQFCFYVEGSFVLDRNKCFELQVEITFC